MPERHPDSGVHARCGTEARLSERLARYGLYPGLLLASLTAAFWGVHAGFEPGLIVAANGLAVGLLCFALEWRLPETPHWKLDAGEARTDLLHAALSNTIPSAIFRALFYGGLVQLAARFSGATGLALWPTSWSLAAQLALAIVVGDCVAYWIHRGYHESRLWSLHAVHHCSPRLYFLLAARKHPIQAFLTYGGRLGLLFFLGVPGDVLGLYAVVAATNSYLQHANLRLSTGFLGQVLATPEFHRWHHSRRPEHANRNYGDVLSVFAPLVGTPIAPPDPERLHQGVGVLTREALAQTYWSHLVLPFRFHELSAEDEVNPERAPAP